jgi:hypothetical protein
MKKPLSAFCEKRNQCNLCRRQQQISRKNIPEAGTKKQCNECMFMLPHNRFESGRNKCKSCRSSKKLKTAKSKYEDDSTNPEKDPRNSGPCTSCGTPFDATTFIWRSDRFCYAAKCKSCSNKCAYYKTYREKKKSENKEEFLEHNAEVMRNYTEKTREKCHALNIKTPAEIARASTHGKMQIYIKSAKTRGLEIAKDDNSLNTFKEYFNSPCDYCGVTPNMRNGELNGLDRIQNDKGYTVPNVVPCCSPCNMMKGCMTIEHFKAQVQNIFTHLKQLPETSGCVVVLNTHCMMRALNKPKTDGLQEIINGGVARKYYVPQGSSVVFYNADTMQIGCITRSLKDAGIISGVNTSNVYKKIKQDDAIWVKPCWKVRYKVDGDEENPYEVDKFKNDVYTLNLDGVQIDYVIYPTEGNMVRFNNITEMASYIDMDDNTVRQWFAKSNYKENDVSIVIESEISSQYSGYKLCSVIC